MLSRFPNSTLKVGAKVSLSPDSEFAYNHEYSNNPVGISGIIDYDDEPICFEEEGDGLKVNWSNGTWNTYRKRDYDLIAEGEPGYLATE